MECPEEPLILPEMQRQTSPFVLPEMQRQVSPGQVKALPMADSDPYPDDFFSRRGVDLPSHLSTKSGRWKSLFVVVIVSAFASGPIASWPTLEPILISEGVFAGPYQEVKLTAVYSIATGIAMIFQIFAGIIYDAVGPRATAAGSAFGIVACLLGMAIGIQFQSLNFLLWICYPAATALGYCNNMGGYAWLYLLPDSQNTVSSLTGAIQVLSDSLVLLAVLFHDKLGLSLPFYFVMCSLLSLGAGVVCLMLIPDQKLSLEVAFVVANPDGDEERGSYGAADSVVKREVESFWDVFKRSFAAFRDCCICFLYYCPGAFFWYGLAYGCCSYMFGMYPQFVMYPFYQALLGTAEATALVDVWGGLYACTGAISLILFGRFTDYVGFTASMVLVNIPILINFALFCTPSFVPQVLGQVLLAFEGNTWYVLVPRWCLSYAPPELYGTAFGITGGVLGLFQMIGTPFGTFASKFIDRMVTDAPSLAMPYLTTMGIWCFFTVASSLAYLLFMRYYPMPEPGQTTMADILNCTKGAKEDMEAKHFTKKIQKTKTIQKKQQFPAHNKESVQKSSTPTCAPCDCLRPQLGSRVS